MSARTTVWKASGRVHRIEACALSREDAAMQEMDPLQLARALRCRRCWPSTEMRGSRNGSHLLTPYRDSSVALGERPRSGRVRTVRAVFGEAIDWAAEELLAGREFDEVARALRAEGRIKKEVRRTRRARAAEIKVARKEWTRATRSASSAPRTRVEHEDRNREVLEMAGRGIAPKEIGLAFGLGASRVRVILRASRNGGN